MAKSFTYREIKHQKEKVIWLFPLTVWVVVLIGLPLYGDDITFLDFYNSMSLYEYINFRWETWSSRIFIDTVAAWMCAHPLIYQGLTVIILFSLSYIILHCAKRIYPTCNVSFLVISLCACYPISLYKWAFIADSINYLWPLAFLLYNLYYIQNYIFFRDQEKSKKSGIHFVALCLLLLSQIFMNDQEQLWCCWLIILFSITICYYLSCKKVHGFLLISLLICILSGVGKALCPGTKVRLQSNIAAYMPEFPMWSITDKFIIANVRMFKQLIAYPKVWILICTGIFLILCVKKKNNTIVRLCALYTFLLTWTYFFKGIVVSATEPYGGKLYVLVTKMLFVPEDIRNGSFSVENCLSVILWLVFCFCIVYEVHFVCRDWHKFLIALIALACGYTSMLMMAFSPTIYASDVRTLTFVLVGFLILDVLLLCEALKDNELITSVRGGIVALTVFLCICATVYQGSYLHAFAQSAFLYSISV